MDVRVSELSTNDNAGESQPINDASRTTGEDEGTNHMSPMGMLRVAVGAVASAVVYVPFCFAVLLQSAVERRGVNTDNWKKEVSRGAWVAGTSVFVALLSLSLAIPLSFSHSGKLNTVFHTKRVLDVSRSAISLFLGTLIIAQCLTVFYAFLRPDLKAVRRLRRRPRVSFFNLLPSLSVLFELFQFGAPFFSSTRISAAFRDIFGAFLFRHGSVENGTQFLVFFWISVGIVLVYSALLGAFIVLALPLGHPLSPLVFSFLSGTLYITVTSTLLGALDCVGDSLDYAVVIRQDTHIQCWSAKHVPLAIYAFLSLLFYSGTAIFVASYKGDISSERVEVRFSPRFACIERTLKNVFVIAAVLVKVPSSAFPIALAIVLALLLTNLRMRPCSYAPLNHLRSVFLVGIVWLGVVAIVSDEVDESDLSSRAVLGTLFGGWSALILAAIALAVTGRCASHSGDHVTDDVVDEGVAEPKAPDAPETLRIDDEAATVAESTADGVNSGPFESHTEHGGSRRRSVMRKEASVVSCVSIPGFESGRSPTGAESELRGGALSREESARASSYGSISVS